MPLPSVLAPRLSALRELRVFPEALIEHFAEWVLCADERELFRVNPISWGESHGAAARDAIDLFIHAAKVGIFDFAWGFLCRDCGAWVTTRGGLRSLKREAECRL